MSTKKKKTPKSLKHIRGGRKPIVPKWKLFRANEPLLSVFMWGVNHTITELSHVPPPRLLMPDDFKAFSKVKVDNHNFNKESMPSHFKVKEYCPNVFRNLRERFGVDEQSYLRSLSEQQVQRCPDRRGAFQSYDHKLYIKNLSPENVGEVHQILASYHQKSMAYYQPELRDSPGRSGAKFYQSADHKYIIKTLCAEEIAEVHSILKGYHEYVVEKHGKTLLPQYLGMYRLTVEGSETYLIVMRNIFGRKYPVHKKFDLKGSTVQRQASEKEKSKELPTFKDNDFLEEGCKFFLPPDARKTLMDMLTSDTEFLSKLHLMDYSLLVGIHDCERAQEEANQDKELAAAAVAKGEGTGDSSEPEIGSGGSGDEFQPTPPDSPVPSVGAFGPLVHSEGGLELDDEFYAISSSTESQRKEIYFIGLVDILTYYGVKKRTAFAAKSVKYGAEAEISTVKPDQYAKRLVDFVSKQLVVAGGATAAAPASAGPSPPAVPVNAPAPAPTPN